MPGPAFWAAVAVSTKMPVPMTAPMPSRVSWKAPSDRLSDFFSAVARMASSDFTRPKIMVFPSFVAPRSGRRPSSSRRNEKGRPKPPFPGPRLDGITA